MSNTILQWLEQKSDDIYQPRPEMQLKSTVLKSLAPKLIHSILFKLLFFFLFVFFLQNFN